MAVLRIGVQADAGPDESAPLEPLAPPDIGEADALRETDVRQGSTRFAGGDDQDTRLGANRIGCALRPRVVQPCLWQGSPKG